MDRRDGNWWHKLTPDQQRTYVLGFFDGTMFGYRFASWPFMMEGEIIDKSALDAVTAGFGSFYQTYLPNTITSTQVTEGLTHLYSDYRNKQLPVEDAVWVVLNEISGKSEPEMTNLIENFRKLNR